MQIAYHSDAIPFWNAPLHHKVAIPASILPSPLACQELAQLPGGLRRAGKISAASCAVQSFSYPGPDEKNLQPTNDSQQTGRGFESAAAAVIPLLAVLVSMITTDAEQETHPTGVVRAACWLIKNHDIL